MFFLLLSSSLSKDKKYKTVTTVEDDKKIREATSFKKGDRIAVTGIFTGYPSKDSTEEQKVQRFMRFYPKVDDLAILQFQDKDCFLVNKYNSTFQLKVGDKTTNLWYYRPLDNPDVVTDFFSAQIDMSKGVVEKISFDTLFDEDSCKAVKLKYRCGVKRKVGAECKKNEMIKTFLAFAGSDNDEVAFVSRQYLPSTFVKFGMRGVVEDAVAYFNKAKDYITGLFE